jgi:hypothetical protein
VLLIFFYENADPSLLRNSFIIRAPGQNPRLYLIQGNKLHRYDLCSLENGGTDLGVQLSFTIDSTASIFSFGYHKETFILWSGGMSTFKADTETFEDSPAPDNYEAYYLSAPPQPVADEYLPSGSKC